VQTITGVMKEGRVELDRPASLPDGTRVRVEPDEEPGFRDDDDWPTTPEGIEALIREMEAAEPVVLTAEDEERIVQARAAVRTVTLSAVRKQMGLDP
jgi:hypothetical protein